MYIKNTEELEKIRQAFIQNQHVFGLYHFHITMEKKNPLEKIPPIFEERLLPVETGDFYKQLQTSQKFRTLEELDALIKTVLQYDVELVGFKLEGVVIPSIKPLQDSLVDFCYYETHKRFDIVPEYKPSVMLSFSQKHNQIVSAQRFYNKETPPSTTKYEVCFYETWTTNVEKPWLDFQKQHSSFLKKKIKI